MGHTESSSNLEVAKRENSVITLEEDYTTKYEGFDPENPESNIIFNLLQHTHLEQSLNLQHLCRIEFREKAKRFDRGVKQDVFMVLWQTTMPSVLIELGFISHPEEEKYMASKQGQDYLASAVYRAFRDYKNAIESSSNFEVMNQNTKKQEEIPQLDPDVL
jgi:N-acetylmuramoyl-L-alanine amidase